VEETVLNDRNSMNIINFRESPECILGILNSKLISFWFVHKFGKMQRNTFPQFKVNELANFPLPKNRQNKQDDIFKIVKQIMVAKKDAPEADITQLDHQIDQIVYELYGLTLGVCLSNTCIERGEQQFVASSRLDQLITRSGS